MKKFSSMAFKIHSSRFSLNIVILFFSSLISCYFISANVAPSSQDFTDGATTLPPPAPSYEQELELQPAAFSVNYATGGRWELLQKSIGITAMHMQVMHNNKVVIFDRTDFGPSNLTLPQGKCRNNDEALKPVDCTAHSVLYDIATNTYRPLMVQTDVWCSSGAVNADGTLIQTGGYHAGDNKTRLFTPCNDDKCDWVELQQLLKVRRWYASDQILPDGRVIIVGGRRQFSYEYFPKNPAPNSPSNNVVNFPFLQETNDPKEENNLYPFLHLLPDGHLFVFANQRSIIFDYVNNRIIKEFPQIPGEKRTYPATGSSVMLPLKLTNNGGGVAQPSPAVEVLICGGAKGGSYIEASKKGIFMSASNTCGRLRVTDPNPQWDMEVMPQHRVMPDMVLLPTGNIVILNGAAKGSAGWECADHPVVNPLHYTPNQPDLSKRFTLLNPTTIPRMYHSTAVLLPDGRILVGGSNPHINYIFTGVRFPTELRLEAFYPPYKAPSNDNLRPMIISVDYGPTKNIVSYGQQFSVTFSMGFQESDLNVNDYTVTMIAPSFTTHSFGMNQRMLVLNMVNIQAVQNPPSAKKITVYAPATNNIAPPGYYMLFVVHQGIPGPAAWIKIQ